MNLAIRTQFHRATARRSARVTATAPCGSKLTIPAWKGDECRGEAFHQSVAEALRDKLGLSGSLVGGQLGDGSFVFVFAPADPDAARYQWLRRFDHFGRVDALLNDVFNTLDAAVDHVMAHPLASDETPAIGTYFCPDASTKAREFPRVARFSVGDKVTTSGYEGRITLLYSDGPNEGARMYEVRLASGTVCVCGSDIQPANEHP